MIDVSVLICVHGRLELTRACLEAVACTAPPGRYEVVVVDNASPDASADAIEQLAPGYPAPLRVVCSDVNLGFVGGNNLAAQHAAGRYLLLLNNDTEPGEGWLEALLETAERDESVGIVGAKLVYPDGRLQEAGGIVFSDASGWNVGRLGDPLDPRYRFVREVDYCSGACLLVRRELWDAVGGLDERYAPAYYEDTDLCFAAREHGYRVLFQPEAVVVHHEGATAGTDTSTGFKRHQVVNQQRFREKWEHELRHQRPPHPTLVRRASNRAPGKRVLVVDPHMPMYDRASGSRRLHELLRLLADLGHAVTFVAYDGTHADRYRGPLEQLGIEVYPGNPSRRTGQPSASSLDLPALLAESAYDLALLCFHDLAAQYLPLIREHSPLTRVLVDTVDVHYVREQRAAELAADDAALASAAATKERELATYARADGVITVTAEDAAALHAELPDLEAHVIPNVHEPDTADIPEPEGRSGMLFVGNFRHPPNADAVVSFCRDVLPLVREQVPGITLTIVGSDPPPAVTGLAGPGVEVTGWVPDVTPYLRSHRISVAPLRYGAGMKGKVGEALAAGLPVVTTTVGAEGMVDGEPTSCGLLVADGPAAMAAAIARLALDDDTWRRLSAAGPSHVRARFGERAVSAALERLLASAGSAVSSGTTSIVILTHGELELTRACLDSIAHHTPEPHELIVVDNGSPDATPAFLEQLRAERPNVEVVLNGANRGFAAGCNQGLALARGDTVLLLNNDTLATPGWLGHMRAALDADPSLGAVGPCSNRVSGAQLVEGCDYGDPYADAAVLERLAVERAELHVAQTLPVQRLVGFCLLLRRSVLERTGGLEQRFGSGNFEDDDLCLRILAAGHGLAVALAAFVHHEGSRTFAAAGIDHTRAMLHNWAVFKSLWGLPAEQPLEGGYTITDELLSHTRYVPSFPLARTHALDTAGVWREDAGRIALDLGVAAVRGSEATALQRAFDEIAGWNDAHRQYETRRRLVATVLQSSHDDPALLAAAASGLLAALEQEPREPLLLNDLGVLLYGLGHGGAAEAVFLAARRLDPGLAGIADNIVAARRLARAARKRRHQGGSGAALAARARALARRAKPDPTLRISLCMIVKDEEEMLPGCLAAAAAAVDEIVVVDTGSSDRTIEIAESFGARVIEYPWTGSFADARNVSLEQATGDWILYLDADEHLAEGEAERLRALAARPWREGFYLKMTSALDDDGAGSFVHQTMRLFRNRPTTRFEGRIHEQHTGSMPLHLPERFEVTDVHVLHHGYTAARVAVRGKHQRNRELLELQAAEGEHADPFTLFNLGTEHLAADRPQEAVPLLVRAWDEALRHGGGTPQYLPSLGTRLVQALRLAGDPAAALTLSDQVLEVVAGHTDVEREAALAARALGDLETAAARAERCLELGDAPVRYAGAVGAGTFLALGLLASIRSDQHRYDEAEELLQRSLAEYPLFRPAERALEDVRGLREVERLLHFAIAGDATTLRRALVEAREAGLPAPEVELFDAWSCVLAGGHTSVGADVAPAVARVLGRLLELGEFDAFEVLLELWSSLPLPERERRDLLARLYLAHGFVDSAQEEWLGLAREQPDAPTLAGLARVAHVRGLVDDARALAGEALRLDPEGPDAGALRELATLAA